MLKALLNKLVFSLSLNKGMSVMFCSSGGKVFQSFGPATAKERSQPFKQAWGHPAACRAVRGQWTFEIAHKPEGERLLIALKQTITSKINSKRNPEPVEGELARSNIHSTGCAV